MARFERFTAKPHALHVKGSQRQPSMADRYLAAIRKEKEEAAALIKTEEELKYELYDFSYLTEVDEYGLPHQTRYQIPDSVPDVWHPESKEEAPKVAPKKVEAPEPE